MPLANTMTGRRSGGRRLLLWIGWIALALVALEAIYLVAGNVLLRTGLLRSMINDGPDSTTVEYASAYTLWPGRVRLTGLRVRDRDHHTEWWVALDEGVARIGLLDLIGRTFHASGVRGKGLVIRIRSRVPAEEATPRWLSYLPDIPGFPDPPVEPAEKDRPKPSSNPWTVRLDGVAVEDVREIWVDEYHITGRSRVTGGLHLVPHRTLELPRTILDVRDGDMQYRNLPGATALTGRVEVAVRASDLKEAKGGNILKFMTGLGRVEGRIDGTQVLDEIVGLAPHVRFQNGHGTVVAEMSLDQGRGTGHLDFAIDDFRAVTEGLRLDGRADGTMRLAFLDLEKGQADFAGSRLRVHDVVVTKDSGRSRPWWMALDLGTGRLSLDPPRVFRSRMTATARDARPLYRLLNTGLPHWAEGMLDIDSMSVHANVALGNDFIELDSLLAEGADYRVEGHYLRRGSQSHGLFLISRGRLDLAASVAAGKTELKMFRAEHWFHERAASF